MAVTLRETAFEQRETVRRLLADYLFEFDRRTEPYPYFDAYWEEPDRLPFLIEADEDLVGLCLIRVRGGGWEIAEFTVVPERPRPRRPRGRRGARRARSRRRRDSSQRESPPRQPQGIAVLAGGRIRRDRHARADRHAARAVGGCHQPESKRHFPM